MARKTKTKTKTKNAGARPMNAGLYLGALGTDQYGLAGDQLHKRIECRRLIDKGELHSAQQQVGGSWDNLIDEPMRAYPYGLSSHPTTPGDGLAARNLRVMDVYSFLGEQRSLAELKGLEFDSVNEHRLSMHGTEYRGAEIYVALDLRATNTQILEDVKQLVGQARAAYGLKSVDRLAVSESSTGKQLRTLEILLAEFDRRILTEVKATSTRRGDLAQDLYPESNEAEDALKKLYKCNKRLFTLEHVFYLQKCQLILDASRDVNGLDETNY